MITILDKIPFQPRILNEVKSMKFPTEYDPYTVCICMITCRAFSLNNNTCPQIPHTTFSILWKHIVKVINRAIPLIDASGIIKGRSARGYSDAMSVVQYSDSDALCKSSRSDLSKRQHSLDKLQSSISVGNIGQIYGRAFHTCYYRSTTQCIHDILGLKFTYCAVVAPRECDHSDKYSALNLYSSEPFMLCLQCGTSGCTAVSVNLQFAKVLLLDEQCTSPMRYIDRVGYLPLCVKAQWQLFETNVRSSTLSKHVISQSRGCILIGAVQTTECTYALWFVRPTVNYSKWMYTSKHMSAHAVKEYLEYAYRAWRPFNSTEITLTLEQIRGVLHVIVSGSLCGVYHDCVPVPATISSHCYSLSLGSSTLRIQVLRWNNNELSMDDVSCNIDLLYRLVPRSRAHPIEVDHLTKYVSLKYLTSLREGPKITLGKNGGLQYHGAVNHVAHMYIELCKCMHQSMHTDEFIECLQRAHLMDSYYMYPSGVPRTPR